MRTGDFKRLIKMIVESVDDELKEIRRPTHRKVPNQVKESLKSMVTRCMSECAIKSNTRKIIRENLGIGEEAQ